MSYTPLLILIADKKEEKRYICEKCNEKFSYASSCRRHMKKCQSIRPNEIEPFASESNVACHIAEAIDLDPNRDVDKLFQGHSRKNPQPDTLTAPLVNSLNTSLTFTVWLSSASNLTITQDPDKNHPSQPNERPEGCANSAEIVDGPAVSPAARSRPVRGDHGVNSAQRRNKPRKRKGSPTSSRPSRRKKTRLASSSLTERTRNENTPTPNTLDHSDIHYTSKPRDRVLVENWSTEQQNTIHGPELFIDAKDVTDESYKTFTHIMECFYRSNSIGSASEPEGDCGCTKGSRSSPPTCYDRG